MSKERELLKKVIQDADDGVMSLSLYKEVMDYLAQPDTPVSKPLSIADVEAHLMICDDLDVGYIDGYIDGMVFAEREHKIIGFNE